MGDQDFETSRHIRYSTASKHFRFVGFLLSFRTTECVSTTINSFFRQSYWVKNQDNHQWLLVYQSQMMALLWQLVLIGNTLLHPDLFYFAEQTCMISDVLCLLTLQFGWYSFSTMRPHIKKACFLSGIYIVWNDEYKLSCFEIMFPDTA